MGNGSPNKILRLVYYSLANAEIVANLNSTFPVILETAVRRNPSDDITGTLLACGGWFLQALEGPQDNVIKTFQRISADIRHEGVTIIRADSCHGRIFSKWSMCGRNLSTTDNAITDILAAQPAFNPPELGFDRALKLLVAVSKIQLPRALAP